MKKKFTGITMAAVLVSMFVFTGAVLLRQKFRRKYQQTLNLSPTNLVLNHEIMLLHWLS